jgi:hypothetical protein
MNTLGVQFINEIFFSMSKAAQGFSPEAYVCTSPRQIHAGQEGGNPRRTPLIGKIAIYGWALVKLPGFHADII